MNDKNNNNKNIFEMDKVELKSLKKTVKSEISTLTSEFNNKTVKMVFGQKMSVPMVFNGKNTTVEDFVETTEFEDIVAEMVENYGIICSNVFNKEGINNDIIKAMSKDIGITTKIFWLCFKKAKIEKKEQLVEMIISRQEYLKEQEEKEKKVGDK